MVLSLLLAVATAGLMSLLYVGEADATTCSSACNQVQRACGHVAKGVGKAALAQCDLERAACQEACGEDPNCPDACSEDRVVCRDAVFTARDAAKLQCQADREDCNQVCVDPIDGACVKNCRFEQKDCSRAAKVVEKACKKACPKGPGRWACVRGCKRDVNTALSVCSAAEAVCILDECIAPPPQP
jgi:hypothetical protein